MKWRKQILLKQQNFEYTKFLPIWFIWTKTFPPNYLTDLLFHFQVLFITKYLYKVPNNALDVDVDYDKEMEWHIFHYFTKMRLTNITYSYPRNQQEVKQKLTVTSSASDSCLGGVQHPSAITNPPWIRTLPGIKTNTAHFTHTHPDFPRSSRKRTRGFSGTRAIRHDRFSGDRGRICRKFW